MKLRYTLPAARQIEAALEYLASASPQAAHSLQERILTIGSLLQSYPHAGHLTSKRGIRRIYLVTFPYLIDYRVGDGEIVVRRFRHSARRPTS